MRRIPLIFGLLLITGLIIQEVHEFFVTNDGIRYFSSPKVPFPLFRSIAKFASERSSGAPRLFIEFANLMKVRIL